MKEKVIFVAWRQISSKKGFSAFFPAPFFEVSAHWGFKF